ncbi:hypothetical protein FKW77_006877 [Venturia effusa]|uniref:Uncharacterized protein n=1 Tax=Venturia effusa TaxID=50376 RepID=A0A517LB15_9PEZI|nr:hypothetical protein FKW77_006877 [Venturia effusa]
MNNPRNLALAGVGVAGGIYFLGINPFNSYGSQNIGNAWSRAGGSQTHSPAIATPLGSTSDNKSNQLDAKGVDSDHFKDNHMDQKVGQPGPIKKAMSNAHYGNENGK